VPACTVGRPYRCPLRRSWKIHRLGAGATPRDRMSGFSHGTSVRGRMPHPASCVLVPAVALPRLLVHHNHHHQRSWSTEMHLQLEHPRSRPEMEGQSQGAAVNRRAFSKVVIVSFLAVAPRHPCGSIAVPANDPHTPLSTPPPSSASDTTADGFAVGLGRR